MNLKIVNVSNLYGTEIVKSLETVEFEFNKVSLVSTETTEHAFRFKDKILKTEPIHTLFDNLDNEDVVIIVNDFVKYNDFLEECFERRIPVFDLTANKASNFTFADTKISSDAKYFNIPMGMIPPVYYVMKSINNEISEKIGSISINLLLSAGYFGKKLMDTLYEETIAVFNQKPSDDYLLGTRYAFNTIPFEFIKNPSIEKQIKYFENGIKSLFPDFSMRISGYLLPQFSIEHFKIALELTENLTTSNELLDNFNFIKKASKFTPEEMLEDGIIYHISTQKPEKGIKTVELSFAVDILSFLVKSHFAVIFENFLNQL